MPGPRPSDEYQPEASVQPQTGMPNDYVEARANPNQFGAQVGEATRGLGQTMGKVGDQLMSVALERQGMINETLATNAESQYVVAAGQISDRVKSLKGHDAVAATPQAVNDLLALRQKVQDSLPNPAARRAFQMLAIRREGYLVQDLNNYSSTQIKWADTQSKVAAAQIAANSLNHLDVAMDDVKFGAVKGDMKFNLVGAFANESGFDSVMHQNPQTGEITFDDSPDGKQAQAQWQVYWDKAMDGVWKTRANTIAYDAQHPDIGKAVQMVIDHKNDPDMPATTYAELSRALAGPYKQFKLAQKADDWIQQDLGPYKDHVENSGSGPTASENLANNNVGNLRTPDGTGWQKFPTVQAGINAVQHQLSIYGSRDHLDTVSGIVSKYAPEFDKDGKKINDTPAYIADVAHKLGVDPNTHLNMADPNIIARLANYMITHEQGGVTPDELLKKQGAVPPGGPTGGKDYMTQGAWLQSHYAENYAAHRHELEQDDYYRQNPDLIESAMARYAQQVNVRVQAEHDQVYGAKLQVYDYLQKAAERGQPVTDISQLYGVPQVGDAMKLIEANDWGAGTAIETRIIPSFSRAFAPTWGTSFGQTFRDVISGKYTEIGQIPVNNNVGYKDQPITNTGLRVLNGILHDMSTPEGHQRWTTFNDWANSASVRGYMDPGHLGPGWESQRGQKHFNDFMSQIIPKWEAAQQKGISWHDFVNSPDTKATIDANKYTRHDKDQDELARPVLKPKIPFNEDSIKNGNDLIKAKQEGHIKDRAQFDRIAKRLGYHEPEAAPIPSGNVPYGTPGFQP